MTDTLWALIFVAVVVIVIGSYLIGVIERAVGAIERIATVLETVVARLKERP